MELKKEKQIIMEAVADAAAAVNEIGRESVARKAALLADKKGINVQVSPYRQDIFYAALDDYCPE